MVFPTGIILCKGLLINFNMHIRMFKGKSEGFGFPQWDRCMSFVLVGFKRIRIGHQPVDGSPLQVPQAMMASWSWSTLLIVFPTSSKESGLLTLLHTFLQIV